MAAGVASPSLSPLRESEGLLDSPAFRESLSQHEHSAKKLNDFMKTLCKEIHLFVKASHGLNRFSSNGQMHPKSTKQLQIS
jgi:hypothetical protein